MQTDERTEAETNAIFAGMEAVYDEEVRRIEASAPQCHLTRMQFHMGEDVSWWECQHCGHTKES